jgi:pilus assembly protein FimV
MMSSVIPARLQFQCGHAALVTLPRVKGETTTQRNERVAREKSAALARQCDFCAPAVEVVVNGNHLVVAEVPLPESVVAETELVAVLEVAAPVEPAVVEAELEVTVADLVAAEIVAEAEAELEVAAEIVAEAEAELEAAVEIAAEAEAELKAAAEIAAEAEAELEAAVVEARVEALTATEPATPVNGELSTPAASAKRRAPVTARRARAAEVIRGRRFLVEYRLERVVRAVDIHDALRQASSLGAAQLTAITRED